MPPPPPQPAGGGWHGQGLRPVGPFLSASFSLIVRSIMPLLPLLIAVAVPVVVSFVAADSALGLTDWFDELTQRTTDLQPGDDLVVPELDASSGEIWTWAIVVGVINIAGTVLVAIAGVVTMWAVRNDRAPGTAEILSLAGRAFLPLLGLSLTVLGIVLAAFVGIGVITVAVPPIGLLLILAMLPLSVWLFTRFGLAIPIAAVEHRGASALRRSYELTSGHAWGVLGRFALFSLILSFATQIVSVPLSFLSFLGSAALAIGTILSFLVSLASSAVGQAGPIILYTDLVGADDAPPQPSGWGQAF